MHEFEWIFMLVLFSTLCLYTVILHNLDARVFYVGSIEAADHTLSHCFVCGIIFCMFSAFLYVEGLGKFLI